MSQRWISSYMTMLLKRRLYCVVTHNRAIHPIRWWSCFYQRPHLLNYLTKEGIMPKKVKPTKAAAKVITSKTKSKISTDTYQDEVNNKTLDLIDTVSENLQLLTERVDIISQRIDVANQRLDKIANRIGIV